MRVEYKNEGTYEVHSLDGAALSFRGGELVLNLDMLQREYPVKLFVFEDGEGRLTTKLSKRYVAEIEIPGKKSGVAETGVVNPFGFPVLRFADEPFSSDEITLTLWATGS